jgi:geranylgeranyl diphosphate synthase, type I
MFENNEFSRFARHWLPLLEDEMRVVLGNDHPAVAQFYGMMHYHMGWVDEALLPGEFGVGKRIRPLLCLMACEAVGGEAQRALPAAAAVEILHNFSLVHDDIEDGDEMRRHRPTMWKLWGVPQAVNAGDGMFALSYQAMLRLKERDVPAQVVVTVLDYFTRMCLRLTEGQYLDLSFEDRADVSVDEYLNMISGKTAALIATSLAIGASVGGATQAAGDALYRFGYNIGLAFQIQDDILGIWGDPALTGKAAGNDLLRQKKSLPVLYALHHPQVGSRLRDLWRNPIGAEELPVVLAILEEAGAHAFAQEQLHTYHQKGLAALQEALGSTAFTSPLMGLADGLAEREA